MMTAVLFPLLFNDLSDICPKVTLYNLLVDADGAVIKVYIIPSQGKVQRYANQYKKPIISGI